MLSMLYALGAILAVLVLIALGISISKPFSPGKQGGVGKMTAVVSYCAVAVQLVIVLAAFLIYRYQVSISEKYQESIQSAPPAAVETTVPESEPSTAPSEDPGLSFSPKASLISDPDNLQITWEISVNDEIVDSYLSDDAICFELDQEYFALPGIATFRGNHYRDEAGYGTAVIEEEAMEIIWSHPIGSLNKWGGCGWTGQPLVVRWDKITREMMNLHENKKNKNDLVEVIYATLDGYIHFYDLEDGSETRDAINIGMNFKGTGSLDPRGYPLLYVGAGLYVNGAAPRMYIINLINGKIIYEYGDHDEFALRDWSAFDSSPLLDAESDTLIWPGENGVLYTIKLNTEYDPEAGTISVNPDTPVKTRYTSYYSQEEKRHLGYESSPVIVDHYLYASENSGLVQCVDLNTMQLIWAQDIKDASSSSPVFQWAEDGRGYLYTAPTLHWTAQGNEGMISIYKLDAASGEILWEYRQKCFRYDDIGGGVQSTPLLGREGTNIGGLIIYSISRTPSAYRGVLTALDTDTGEKIWEISSGNYTWSSPVALYTEDGHAYLFLANASGVARLIDGSTGEVLDTLDFGQTVEASPVVFDNMVVIGTREGIYGVRIS